MRGCTEKERERETKRRRGKEGEREIQRRKKRREKEESAGSSVEELHTEELENALFRLHSHRLRWVCREREIPAK